MHHQTFWQLHTMWQLCAMFLGQYSPRHQRIQDRVLTLNMLLTALLVPWKHICSVLGLSAGAVGLSPSSAASMLLSASGQSLLPLLPILGSISSTAIPEPFQVRCLSGSPGVVASACHLWQLSRSIFIL